jgi:hypothetical protein
MCGSTIRNLRTVNEPFKGFLTLSQLPIKIGKSMRVEIFSLCDFASADASGKLTIVGVFDTIWAREVPATHGLCAIALRIRFDRIEEGLKKLKISFIDWDGNPVMPAMELQIQVQIPPIVQQANVQVVFLIPQLKLPHFGEYAVDLAVDSRQEASTPLFVRQVPIIPPLPQTPPPP